MLTKVLDHGTLHIKNDVIARIISVCIEETEGIEMISTIKDGVVGIVNKNYFRNGITIIENEGELEVEVKISLAYGKNITQTCLELQEMIKKEIEVMTELEINHIRVRVEELTAKQI